MVAGLLRSLRDLGWEHVVVERVDSEDEDLYYVVGYCEPSWRICLRDAQGRSVRLPGGYTDRRIGIGIAGDTEFEDCGDGFLSVTIPVSCESATSCPETREFYSEDGGLTWTLVVE